MQPNNQQPNNTQQRTLHEAAFDEALGSPGQRVLKVIKALAADPQITNAEGVRKFGATSDQMTFARRTLGIVTLPGRGGKAIGDLDLFNKCRSRLGLDPVAQGWRGKVRKIKNRRKRLPPGAQSKRFTAAQQCLAHDPHASNDKIVAFVGKPAVGQGTCASARKSMGITVIPGSKQRHINETKYRRACEKLGITPKGQQQVDTVAKFTPNKLKWAPAVEPRKKKKKATPVHTNGTSEEGSTLQSLRGAARFIQERMKQHGVESIAITHDGIKVQRIALDEW